MNTFTVDFSNLFLKKEQELNPKTVEDLWNIFKECSRELDIESRKDLDLYSYLIEYCSYEDKNHLNLRLYYHMPITPKGNPIDLNSSFVCNFKVSEELKDLLEDEYEEFSGDYYQLDKVFSMLEEHKIYQIFKDYGFPYKLDWSADLEVKLADGEEI